MNTRMGRKDGTPPRGSRGRPIVVLQHPADPLSALNRPARVSRRGQGTDQSVVQPLMIPFVVIVCDEPTDGAPERALAEKYQALDAGLLDGAHEAFCERIQVRRAGGEPQPGSPPRP